jgi:hypothetical protein
MARVEVMLGLMVIMVELQEIPSIVLEVVVEPVVQHQQVQVRVVDAQVLHYLIV